MSRHDISESFPSVVELERYWVWKQSGFQRFMDFKRDILDSREGMGPEERRRERQAKIDSIPRFSLKTTEDFIALAGQRPECFGTGDEKAWCLDCPWLGECTEK